MSSAGGERLRFECGLRLRTGTLGPLRLGRWAHGRATVQGREVSFVRYVGGARVLRRAAFVFSLDGTEVARESKTSMSQAWSVRPGLEVLPLTLPMASLEVALRARDVGPLWRTLVSST